MSLCHIRQFRISSALDDERQLPTSLQRHVDACPSCGSFLAQARALGDQMGAAPSTASPPAWMHTKIMAQLRASVPERQARSRAPWLAAAAGIAAIAGVVGMIAINMPPGTDAEFETASVQISAPVTPLHPASVPGRLEQHAKQALSTEFQNLAADISGARKFLSASLRNTIPGLGGE
jgi:hypothetical protein